MSKEIVRNQYVISLRNGMIAYIVADKLEDIAGALQNNKFFNTKEEMLINTADLVSIMSPREWDEQIKYQRGWYKSHRGTKWFNKKGEYQEETHLGLKFQNAERAIQEILMTQDKERAISFLQKLKDSPVRYMVEDMRGDSVKEIEKLVE